jgi:1-deoxy-D-xylulose-5-phosphate reductoisomerase
MNRRLIILGSTGSIGTQALEVVEHINALHEKGTFPFGYDVVGLAAGRNLEVLVRQAARFGSANLAVASDPDSKLPDILLDTDSETKRACFAGPGAAESLVRDVPCDVVLAAMVGSAGLPATFAAVKLGRTVALANKETLVAAGALIIPAARSTGAKLLPIDSEHAALWQCLGSEPAPPFSAPASLRRAILTASGGPFRTWTKQQVAAATPDQALKHPTWTMGKKVTIDSASLMNKALEVIEAHWLFGLPEGKIDALIHPQSLVHAMAEFEDGTLISQLAAPDMRSPIQHALTWPHRAPGVATRLAPESLNLEFAPIDHDRFPLFKLGHRAIKQGGTAGAILSAANEAAVAAFLEGNIPFGRMQEAILETVETVRPTELRTLLDCLTAEAAARECVLRLLKKI